MFNDSGRDSPDEEAEVDDDEEDNPDGVDVLDEEFPEELSMQDSLTMEQFNSPLVESQYKSTYAIVANTGWSLLLCLYFSIP